MQFSSYATALVSTAWRGCVLIFLRILPSSLCKIILPPLWALYMTLWLFGSNPEPPLVQVNGTNGTAGSDQKKEPVVGASPFKIWSAPPLTTLILSLPSTDPFLRITNFTINLLLLLAAAEFVFYPLYDDAASVIFTRLGAVYPHGAKIVVRYPSLVPTATQNLIHINWRQVGGSFESPWQDGPVVNLTSEEDWVSTAQLEGLWPNTAYEYRLKNETSVLPYPAEPIKFKTFPDPRLSVGSHFRFLVSSCTTPNFPYQPLQGRRIKGFDHLAEYVWPSSSSIVPSSHVSTTHTALKTEHPALTNVATSETASVPAVPPIANPTSAVERAAVEFMLFLGDFIYADVPVYFGDDQDLYRQFYRRNYQSPSFRKVYERLPIFHTYDDHDIKNNYVGQSNDTQPPFQNASSAYRLYSADANYDPIHNDSHYYDFRYGDAAFFVMDTRRYRSEPSENPSVRTMLGEKQLSALHNWLGKVNTTTTFKFIVSSVPFTSLWQRDAQIDSWAAYAHEKAALLSVLHTIPNVIILSGDRHEFAAIKFTGPDYSHPVLEVSTSPLSMFWVPFVRTLKMESHDTVVHKKVVESPSSRMVVEELVPKEKVLKYIPEGNYKFSSLEVDTRDSKHPVVNLEVVIDGDVAYKLSISGEPVQLQLQTSTALGAFVPQSFKGVLDKLGLLPSQWF